MENRLLDMLSTSMGKHVAELLKNPVIVEVMLNPDGKLWYDSLETGRNYTGYDITHADAERIIYLVASHTESICNKDNPIISAELPGCGSRFQGFLPPIVTRPSFTIRKKAILIYTLEDYVKSEIMTISQMDVIKHAVITKKNILVVGGTGTGKTTLSNAILNEIAKTNDRIIIIEDTQELQCTAPDTVFLRSKEGIVTMQELLKGTMRLRPDRIVVGEVRGGEALALLKAWNTGHPGGLCTVHANSTYGGLTRLEQLIQEVVTGTVSKELIAEAVNYIIFIERVNRGRRVRQISKVEGVSDNKYVISHI